MIGRQKRKGIYNIIFSILYKLLAVLVSFIIPRLFIINYGSEVNGLQGSIAQLFMYIGLLEAGIGDASVQALYRPLSEKDYKKANGILSATSIYYNKIAIIYFFILIIVCGIYSSVIHVGTLSFSTVYVYILLYGAVTGFNFFYWSKINVLMRASGDLYVLSILNIISYIVNNVIKVIVILKCWNIVWMQVGYLCVSILCTILCYIYIKKYYRWISFSEKPDKIAIEKKNYALVHNINYVVFSSIDITLLTIFCDLKIVSVYTIYRMIVTALAGITTPFIDGITFVLGHTYREENKKPYCKLIDAVDLLYSTFSFALFTVMYILMQPFMRIYTKDFSDINYILKYVPLLYIIIELFTVGREAMNRTVNIAGKFKETWYIAFIETIINIFVSVILVIIGVYILKRQEYALYGVLTGTAISMFYRTIAINKFSNSKILNRISYFSYKLIFVNLIIFFLVSYLAKYFIPIIDNYYSFFIIAIPLTIIVEFIFFVVQLLLNKTETIFLYEILKKKVRK